MRWFRTRWHACKMSRKQGIVFFYPIKYGNYKVRKLITHSSSLNSKVNIITYIKGINIHSLQLKKIYFEDDVLE